MTGPRSGLRHNRPFTVFWLGQALRFRVRGEGAAARPEGSTPLREVFAAGFRFLRAHALLRPLTVLLTRPDPPRTPTAGSKPRGRGAPRPKGRFIPPRR